MGKPQLVRPVEELADARKAKRNLDSGNLQVVPVSEMKKEIKAEEKLKLVPMKGALPKKPIRHLPRIQ